MTNYNILLRYLFICLCLCIKVDASRAQICDYVAAYPNWTSYCPDAVPVCQLLDLEITSCTPPDTVENGDCEPGSICDGVGSIENASWFAFNAPLGEWDLYIEGDCGIQAAIYDDCPCNGGTCVWGDGGNSTIVTTTVDFLLPKKNYYLIIDGNKGEECNYFIDITPNFDSSEDAFVCSEFVIEACQDEFSGTEPNEFTLSSNDSILITARIPNSGLFQNYECYYGSTTQQTSGIIYLEEENITDDQEILLTLTEEGSYTVCIDAISDFCNNIPDCDFPICTAFTVKNCPEEYFFSSEEVCYSDLLNIGYFPIDENNNIPWLGDTLFIENFDQDGCAQYTGLDCGCDVIFKVCPDFLGNTVPEIYNIYLEEGEEYCYDTDLCVTYDDDPFLAFLWGQGSDGCDGLYYEGRPQLMDLVIDIDTTNNLCESFGISIDIEQISPSDFELDSLLFVWLNSDQDTIGTGPFQLLAPDQDYTLIYGMIIPNPYEEDFDLLDTLRFNFSEFCPPCNVDTLIQDGDSYADLDRRVDDFYASNIENCSSIKLIIDYNFSLPWEGDENMESCDETCQNSSACSCSLDMSTFGGCNNCWDFMSFALRIDGIQVESEIIGDQGTTDAEQSGRFEREYCLSDETNIRITISNQNWEPEEINSYEVLLVCYDNQIAPLNEQTVCEEGELTLEGIINNPDCAISHEWTSRDGSKIDSPFNLKTYAYDLIDQDVFTLSVTDSLGCSFQEQFVVNLIDCPACFCPENIDPNAVCSTIYDPVCGCNDVTYSNACVAEKEFGVVHWTKGPCFSTNADPIIFADLTLCDTVLSQDLFSFGLSRINKSVKLNWEATNIDRFEILKSENGLDFEVLDLVNAKDINQLLEYSYLDKQPNTGSNYYQLKLFQNTNESHTQIKHIYFDPELNKANIFPIPVESKLYFEHNELSPGALSIYNLNGQSLEFIDISYDDRVATLSQMDQLSTGVYLIVFRNGDSSSTHRIVKL